MTRFQKHGIKLINQPLKARESLSDFIPLNVTHWVEIMSNNLISHLP